MVRCLCYNEDGVCGTGTPPSLLYEDVTQPVGAIEGRRGHGNLPADVRTVQALLNKVPTAQGGPDPKLAVDGQCGPKTRAAIRAFQARQFPQRAPDGIVDPKYETIYRLNEIAYPDVDAGLVAVAQASLATVASMLLRTINLIGTVQSSWALPNPLFTNDKAVALLNYHFKLDKSANRSFDLDRIRRTFQDMLTVSGHVPRGPNQKAAFGIIASMPTDSMGKRTKAYAYAGGWKHYQGVVIDDTFSGVKARGDTIYLTRTLLNTAQGGIVYAISHELAHFVGGVNGAPDFIDDRAYHHRQQAQYEALTTEQSILNADCYSQFNWEVNHGSRYRP